MESNHQVIVLDSSAIALPVSRKPDSLSPNSGHSAINGLGRKAVAGNSEGFVGVLDVFVHQARDIHNICIYHKQDVYARICLTSDPETKVSTQTINGGGQNPVFNEKLQINVRTVDSSLKCEIWMLSRVRNYLQDQLLGFALVPVSEILLESGKVEKEYELSSSDLFHSPSGFVKLTLNYTGSMPEVLDIPSPLSSVVPSQESEPYCSSNELAKIEFPDPNVMKENERMVSEYYAIPCPDSNDNEKGYKTIASDADCHKPERVAKENHDTIIVPNFEVPPTDDSSSTNGEEKEGSSGEVGNGVSNFSKPVVSINVEAIEQKVMQQDIVDMYMKSMNQFTEALAKMKLPLDIQNGSVDSDGKTPSSKGEGPSPKVFYGSRAFF